MTSVRALILAVVLASASPLSAAAVEVVGDAAAPQSGIDGRPWPRDYAVDGLQFSLFRPQLDTWTGNRLKARLAIEVDTGPVKDKSGKTVQGHRYGVAWISARTETDKDAREVTLDDVQIEKVAFPTAPADDARYLAAIRKVAPTAAQVVSLDQIESSLAMTQATRLAASKPVDNTPPEILIAFKPAVLVPIDGPPVWKPSGVAGVEKVVNTRALLLREAGRLYLGHGGLWATADRIEGPWTAVKEVSQPLRQAMQAAGAGPSADQAAKAAMTLLDPSSFPDVVVRTAPAELIVVDGEPDFQPIAGTDLSYIANTPADVFVDAAQAGAWYVLVSGRWFTATSSKGPWTYVAPAALPAGFKAIPGDSAKSAVLASVPGTPEAKEALVANAIPQTATVDRRTAAFAASYDGEAQFKPIAGTDLAYAANAPVPVIRVTPSSYYALDKGVWFTAAAPAGPWAAATSVPAAIYAIPTSSPLHYVTYVQVYGSDGDQVRVGYTPGYYGTVVSNGVVVYGTGYSCASWVGDVWYGCPATYGYGAAFGYAPAVGWTMAFGWGWDGYWYDPWWGPWYGYYPGYWGGAVAGNVYGRWGNSVVAGTAAAWANPWTGNYGRGFSGGYHNTVTGGRGAGYAGRNTNVYTGRSTAAAGGVRYNPETGRVVAGQGGSVSNIYTGAGAVAGSRTAVNTNTGRTTTSSGAAARSVAGATVAGGFNSQGAAGDVRGAGYARYDRSTGEVNRGGVVDVGGNIYAGHDGNVYKRTDNGWEKAGRDGGFSRTQTADRSLNQERAARDRGAQRDAWAGRPAGMTSSSMSFDRSAYGAGYHGAMGGFRGGGFHAGAGYRRR